MRRHNVNLARRPFVNQRPVVRISGLLWGLGLALLLVNVWLYWSFYQGQGETRDRLAELGAAMAQEQSRIQELENRLASIDLEAQNEQVAFLNQRIERRTFGWSMLFDTLAEVLPRDVRLARLRPERRQLTPSERRERATGTTPRVPLSISGQAKTHEELYTFLDALIASPAFRDVDPRNERLDEQGMVMFQLDVIFLPEQAVADQAEEPEASEGGEDADRPEDAPGDGQDDEMTTEAAAPVQQVRATPEGAS